MKSAYNEIWIQHLQLIKEVKQWQKHHLISMEQYISISAHYPSALFHPNFIIRILLFIASLIALSGATGLLALFLSELMDNATTLSVLCIIYGIGSFAFLEGVFIRNAKHFKSGVTEALLYHAVGFTLGGIAGLSDFNIHTMVISGLLLSSFCAFRYLDLLSTITAICLLAYFIFYELYGMGGILQQIIPIVFILFFTPLYFFFRKLKDRPEAELWHNCLTLAEVLTLLIIYAAGNYLVVRELSVNLMDLELMTGRDIPFALLFYFLTIIVPVAYIYFGLKYRDAVLIRTSLFVLAFSVFTFKYYYSTGHPEITLTTAGAILIVGAIMLLRYLKTPQHGYTREDLLGNTWGNANLEAFIISQTLGGNHPSNGTEPDTGGGGTSAGGGSTESF